MVDAERSSTTARTIGVGCFTAFAGLWSGGMVAVLIAKFAGVVRHCAPTEYGAPCDWAAFAAVGMLVGAVSLPTVALLSLRRRDRSRTSARG
ncbi:MAG: hypothetical protein NVS1B4_13010 [Gemmatimonadaceae bacterium]